MSASIKQHAHDTVIATNKYHRPPHDVARAVIAGMRHLGLVTDIGPALVEDPASFIGETLRIGERAPIYPKQSGVLVI
jgi:hypothetical protein